MTHNKELEFALNRARDRGDLTDAISAVTHDLAGTDDAIVIVDRMLEFQRDLRSTDLSPLILFSVGLGIVIGREWPIPISTVN